MHNREMHLMDILASPRAMGGDKVNVPATVLRRFPVRPARFVWRPTGAGERAGADDFVSDVIVRVVGAIKRGKLQLG